MKRVEALLDGAVGRVAPLLRAEVLHHGQLVFAGGNAPPTLRFDLASITKVMVTTALALDLHLDRETPIAQLLPSSVLREVTLDDLLFHRSGLRPFVPFFAHALEQYPSLRDAECPLRAQVRREVIARVLATPPEAPNRTRLAYSDLGFIALGAALEASTQLPLDELYAQRLAQPLGLTASFQRVSANHGQPTAPTGLTRPREPAPGQEGQWQIAAAAGRAGEVDDDNAWAMDGVSGHAGLFGTAHDVALFGQALLDGRFGTDWPRDPFVPGSTRTVGFDTPGLEAPSCGARFGRAGPRGAIGHLGFTGTSVWVDLDREVVAVLLTNRVAFGRANLSIREFRPAFHDAVLEALGL